MEPFPRGRFEIRPVLRPGLSGRKRRRGLVAEIERGDRSEEWRGCGEQALEPCGRGQGRRVRIEGGGGGCTGARRYHG